MYYYISGKLPVFLQENNVHILSQEYISRYLLETPLSYIENRQNDSSSAYFYIEENKDIRKVTKMTEDEFHIIAQALLQRPLRSIKSYCRIDDTPFYMYQYERHPFVVIEFLPHQKTLPDWASTYKSASIYTIWKSVNSYGYS